MASETLEERVALIEREILTLKRQMPRPDTVPWWEQIAGIFADVPAFDEAAELGRQYREAQRPVAEEEPGVSA